jgi:hypothetical protein
MAQDPINPKKVTRELETDLSTEPTIKLNGLMK